VSFGGRVSQELRDRVTNRLATALCETYGTSEVCTIGAIWGPGTDGFGTIPPRAAVEVLDERGNRIPMGRDTTTGRSARASLPPLRGISSGFSIS
jgi:hypothetical protein